MCLELDSKRSKPSHGGIFIFWDPILYTFLYTKIQKFSIVNFFLSMHVQDPGGSSHQSVILPCYIKCDWHLLKRNLDTVMFADTCLYLIVFAYIR